MKNPAASYEASGVLKKELLDGVCLAFDSRFEREEHFIIAAVGALQADTDATNETLCRYTANISIYTHRIVSEYKGVVTPEYSPPASNRHLDVTLSFALERKEHGAGNTSASKPGVVGGIITLGRCYDTQDLDATGLYSRRYISTAAHDGCRCTQQCTECDDDSAHENNSFRVRDYRQSAVYTLIISQNIINIKFLLP